MAKGMTKSEVIKTLAEKTDVDRKTTIRFMDNLVALVVKEAKRSGEFLIPGLGKAVKANRKARMGRNPATGETIKIPAKTVVKFRLAKAFKDSVVPPKAKK
ncbi:MAG TPA: HU family DNA-binding protein [Candidatus Eremiobacteraceae bacterium]